MFKLALSALVASALALSSCVSVIADVTGRSAAICGGDPAFLVRGYNATTVDWFYTTDTAYMGQLVKQGYYTSKGNAAKVFTTQVQFSIPLYQCGNSAVHDHLYTTNATERDAFGKEGYDDEGIAAYIFPDPLQIVECGVDTVPLYRMYNPTLTSHFYTTNTAEMQNAVNKDGYVYEEITGYVFAP